MFVDAYVFMYCKYRDSLFNKQYSYPGKKYSDVPVHRCITAGLVGIYMLAETTAEEIITGQDMGARKWQI